MSDKKYSSIENVSFKLPALARGEVVPPFVYEIERREAERKRAERKATLYFIGGLVGTFVGTIVGWLLGKYF